MSATEYRIIRVKPFVEKVIHLETIDSTNRFAKDLKEVPRQGLLVIIAGRQTAGRGQREKSFFSDISGGLWVSLVVPVKDIAMHFSINRAISLALCETVSSRNPAGNAVRIKWPNDIYWNNRKICGILLESVSSRPDRIIVGFGLNVNVNEEQFPLPLRAIATSLQIETGKSCSLEMLLEEILIGFESFRHMNESNAHRRYIENLYRPGEPAYIGSHEGVFESVREDGQACMRTARGYEYFISGPLEFVERAEIRG